MKKESVRSPWMLPVLGLLPLLLVGCSSIDLPTVEESRARIERRTAEIAAAEVPLGAYAQRYTSRSDGTVTVRGSVFNALFAALASSRSDDVLIAFPPTRPLVRERKSIFGISYTNHLDIDSGRVSLNLRSAQLLPIRGQRLRVLLDLEGEGRIFMSGKYTGIGATASPRIQLALRDTVALRVRAGENGSMQFVPEPGIIMLEATLHVNLLGWEVPWTEDIALKATDILPPVSLPAFFGAEIKIPVPAASYGDRNYEFVARPVDIRDSRVVLEGDRMTWLFDCVFR